MAHSLREWLEYPNAVADISKAIIQRGRSSESNAEVLRRLQEASTWDGASGSAAREASGRHAATSSGTAEENLKLGVEAKRVWDGANDVAKGIRNIVADASGSANGEPSMDIDLDMNRVVVPAWVGNLNPKNPDDAQTLAKVQAKVERLNQRIATALQAGQTMDIEFAQVINGGTGGKVVQRATKESPDERPKADGQTQAAGAGGVEVAPDQKVKDWSKSKGAPFGQDILKDGANGKQYQWGDDLKVNKPEGPVLSEAKTKVIGGTVKDLGKGGGELPDWAGKDAKWGWSSKFLTGSAGAGGEVRTDGGGGSAKVNADIVANEAHVKEIRLGPLTLNGQISGALGVDGKADSALTLTRDGADAPRSGIQFGGDAMAGLRGGQQIDAKIWGLGVKNTVNEYAGGGGALHFYGGWQGDEFKFGGRTGLAWGLGLKDTVEISIAPKEVAKNIGKLWAWANN
ncbi:hypothetical protein MSTE_00750 [Mycobacteroides stephanolepidis]|uniref:Uncharacterized protein n=1 Tax=[Mycobacterium] stephanolepidis TaxID=1520670 RepID=A0A1Z4ET04_9MYCO|nr:hypothetical protein [[Mycobacterium] stephanolepidis]BAX96085.1 hypothetical protein MSTE_00750 [[Mycobacterium] stephanolepidis]